MKKKYVLALTVLATSALSTQMACAQNNVTIYGRINMDIETIKISNPTGGTSGDVNRVSSNSSRLGFRGSEDLGGGLQAIFQIESSIGPDEGTATFAGRDSFVGLNGSWGKLRAGIMEDPFKGMGEFTDVYLGTGLADDGTITALGGGGSGFIRRQINSIRYDSPTFGGFQAQLQYGLQKEDPVTPEKSLTIGGAYTLNRLKLGAVYQEHRNFTPGRKEYAYRLGAKYEFAAFDLRGGYTHVNYDLPAGTVTHDYWTIASGIKVGPNGLISLKYGWSPNGRGSAPDGTVSPFGSDNARIYKGPDSGARVYTLGYEHNLSKRTQLYGYYTRISNDANANYRFGTNGVNNSATGPGADPSAFVIGIVHNF